MVKSVSRRKVVVLAHRRCNQLAEKHPYAPGPGGISAAINQFRKSFPTTVTAETLKSLAIAPMNESYIINVLRFIGAVDKDGKRTEKAATVFSHHDDADFHKAFEEMVKTAYGDLFSLHGNEAWSLDTNKLISFFRSKDKTTDLVGQRQATTFQLLSSFAGHGAPLAPAQKSSAKSKAGKPARQKTVKEITRSGGTQANNTLARDVGLTVRIEVNLPAAGDQETYDRIFRSIRENLLDAK